MTTGELIVVALFGVGLLCSLSLLWWLRKLIRQEGDPSGATSTRTPEAATLDADSIKNGRKNAPAQTKGA